MVLFLTKSFFSLICLFVFSLGLYSQSIPDPKIHNSDTLVYSVGVKKEVMSIKDQVDIIDRHLAAIETKKKYILSDSILTVKAKNDNWFEEMDTISKDLLLKKNRLINSLNSSKIK